MADPPERLFPLTDPLELTVRYTLMPGATGDAPKPRVLPEMKKETGPLPVDVSWIPSAASVSFTTSSVAAPAPPWVSSTSPCSSVSPSMWINWSPVADVLAWIDALPAKSGWKPVPARSVSALPKLIDSAIGPLLRISTVSPGLAASTHAWSMPLHGGADAGHTRSRGPTPRAPEGARATRSSASRATAAARGVMAPPPAHRSSSYSGEASLGEWLSELEMEGREAELVVEGAGGLVRRQHAEPEPARATAAGVVLGGPHQRTAEAAAPMRSA